MSLSNFLLTSDVTFQVEIYSDESFLKLIYGINMKCITFKVTGTAASIKADYSNCPAADADAFDTACAALTGEGA